MQSFHNSIGLKFHELTLKESKCLDQEQLIIVFYKKDEQGREFTPVEINQYVFGNTIPLTSVRRAMTNLTNYGLLEKTSNKKEGLYGMMNYTWKLKVNKLCGLII